MNCERPRRRWKAAALLLALTVAAVASGTAADGLDGAADGARRLQTTGGADDTAVVVSSAGSGSGSGTPPISGTTSSTGGTTGTTTGTDPTSGTTSGTDPTSGTTSGTDPSAGTTSGTDPSTSTGSSSTGGPTDPSTSTSTSTSKSTSGSSGSTSSTGSSGSASSTGSSGSSSTTPSPPPSTTKPTTPSTPTTTAPATTTTSPTTAAPATSTTKPSTTAPSTTTAPTTSTPRATTGTSVVHYNSSTLPPSISESELNGAELVRVEVTKTTNPDGTTTYSYVVVSKVGDQVQTFNETSTVATDVISSGSSSSTGGAQASDGNSSSSSSSGLSSGGLVAVVIGGIVFVALLIGFFVFRRRQIHKNRESPDSDDDVIESPVLHDHPNLRKGPSTWGVNYEEITARTDPTQSSTGSIAHRSRRSGSEWEDPVIVAARVPFDRVKIGDLLGKGAYGEVFRGEFRDQEVAVKKLLPDTKKNMKHITDFLSEIRLLAAMEHPHIVHFVGVAWDALSDLMCLTEFMAGGDLRSLLIKYHEARHPLGFDAQKATIALHIAHGLTYLHSLTPIVLHRDLKSRNILLTNTLEAKLTDFGVSRERSDRTMTAGVGSCLWMAPEVMMGRRYDEKADVFSLGIVLSELDTHELPYSHAKDSQTGAPMMDMAVLQQVTAGRLSVQLSDRLQPSLRYLVTACVGLDPRQRPTAAQALYELQVIARSLK